MPKTRLSYQIVTILYPEHDGIGSKKLMLLSMPTVTIDTVRKMLLKQQI